MDEKIHELIWEDFDPDQNLTIALKFLVQGENRFRKRDKVRFSCGREARVWPCENVHAFPSFCDGTDTLVGDLQNLLA